MKTMQNVGKLTSPKLDKTGIVFSTLGFGGLLYGFSDAGTDGWGSTTVIACLILGTWHWPCLYGASLPPTNHCSNSAFSVITCTHLQR